MSDYWWGFVTPFLVVAAVLLLGLTVGAIARAGRRFGLFLEWGPPAEPEDDHWGRGTVHRVAPGISIGTYRANPDLEVFPGHLIRSRFVNVGHVCVGRAHWHRGDATA